MEDVIFDGGVLGDSHDISGLKSNSADARNFERIAWAGAHPHSSGSAPPHDRARNSMLDALIPTDRFDVTRFQNEPWGTYNGAPPPLPEVASRSRGRGGRVTARGKPKAMKARPPALVSVDQASLQIEELMEAWPDHKKKILINLRARVTRHFNTLFPTNSPTASIQFRALQSAMKTMGIIFDKNRWHTMTSLCARDYALRHTPKDS